MDSANITALIKRGFMELEEQEWERADEFFEKVLNVDAEASMAHLGKLMIELKVSEKKQLINCSEPFDSSANYKRAVRFGDDELKKELEEINCAIRKRNETTRVETTYKNAVERIKAKEYAEAVKLLEKLDNYKDTNRLLLECKDKLESIRKDGVYNNACELLENCRKIEDIENAAKMFASVINWKDAKEKINECRQKAANFEEPIEEETAEEYVEVAVNNVSAGDKIIAWILLLLVGGTIAAVIFSALWSM